MNRIFLSVPLTLVLLCGCVKNQPNPAITYLARLDEAPGADLHGAAETEALTRFRTFLENLDSESIAKNTSRVYSTDAYLNDTLSTKTGAAAIEKYFLGTAENAEEIHVEVLDTTRSGNDYYLRWVMDIKFKKFHRGKSFRSVGMTHVRFDADGKVILHQDYWDSAHGFFEQVPILGSAIRWIKSLL